MKARATLVIVPPVVLLLRAGGWGHSPPSQDRMFSTALCPLYSRALLTVIIYVILQYTNTIRQPEYPGFDRKPSVLQEVEAHGERACGSQSVQYN